MRVLGSAVSRKTCKTPEVGLVHSPDHSNPLLVHATTHKLILSCPLCALLPQVLWAA